MAARLLALAALALLAGCGAAEHRVDPATRQATFTFDPSVSERDRDWILAAVDRTRPEARQLIDDVDGMVTLGTFRDPGGPAVGLTRPLAADRYEVTFNVAYLDGDRRADRDKTVAHELGHVIDFALMTPDLRDRLAAQLPSSGACFTPESGDCTAPEERFADTFALWALRGAVSATGAGYGVLPPASVEDWGAPLAKLAIDVEVASR
ncbi:MAG TPA: hypothetical protein VNS09_09690 [Solirubrobacter sp.]|nr:hypothetical protein [Solirubrobacter sp.]